MNQNQDSGRATAMAARLTAAARDAAAAQVSVRLLERQVLAAQLRAERLAQRLASIERHARLVMPHTLDQRARAALGDIVLTAQERDEWPLNRCQRA